MNQEEPIRHNNLTGIIGIMFAMAVAGNDFQKSGLPLDEYLQQKFSSAGQAIVEVADVLTPKNLTAAEMQGLAAGVVAPK